jgi:hypothetical protein
MPSRLAHGLAAALLAATCLLSHGATAAVSAHDREQARKNANAGFESFSAGDYASALTHFQDAESTMHAPPHLLFIARALDKLGRLLEARETYRRLVGEHLPRGCPGAFRDAQKSAGQELQALDARIPKVKLTVEGVPVAAARISLDGAAIATEKLSQAVEADPGKHHAHAEADGFSAAEQSFELQAGAATLEVKLVLAKKEDLPAGSSTTSGPDDGEGGGLSVPAFVLVGVGAASLVAGAVTGGLALSRAGELRDKCPQSPCPTENQSLADQANTLATVSTVTLIVGGVAAAAGVVWLVVDATSSTSEPAGSASDLHRLSPWAGWRLGAEVGPSYLGLTGAF